MNLQEFVAKYENKTIDFDGSFGNQCVDLYRQYVKEVLQKPQSPGVAGAADIWTTYLPDHYEKVVNTPEGIPLPGDIVIWNRRYGPYGHVAVFLSGDVNRMTCFSQNDPTGSPCVKKVYGYTNIYGWLHPKGNTMPQVTLESSKFEELVSKATFADQVMALGYQSAAQIDNEIKELGQAIEDKNRTIEATEIRADEARKTLNDLIVACSKALETVQEVEQIKGALSKVSADLDDYADLKRNFAELQLHTKEQDEMQEREIARLKALVEQKISYSDLSSEELAHELVKIFREFIRRSFKLFNMAK